MIIQDSFDKMTLTVTENRILTIELLTADGDKAIQELSKQSWNNVKEVINSMFSMIDDFEYKQKEKKIALTLPGK